MLSNTNSLFGCSCHPLHAISSRAKSRERRVLAQRAHQPSCCHPPVRLTHVLTIVVAVALVAPSWAAAVPGFQQVVSDFSIVDSLGNDVSKALIGSDGHIDRTHSPVMLYFRAHNTSYRGKFFAELSPLSSTEVSVYRNRNWTHQASDSSYVLRSEDRLSVLTAEGRELSGLVRKDDLYLDLAFSKHPSLLRVTRGGASDILHGLKALTSHKQRQRHPPHERHREKQDDQVRSLRFAPDEIAQWTNCFTGSDVTKQVDIGIAVAPLFYKEWGSEAVAKAYIVSIVAKANLIYEPQINVVLHVKYLEIITEVGDLDWVQQSSCSMLMSQQLAKFAATQKTDVALWSVMDNCLGGGGGTAGMALVGVLCDYTLDSNSLWSNRAVVWYNSGSTWLTFAHEIGHNFGASHSFENGQGTTGGIMDYGDGTFNGIYQFNTEQPRPAEICAEIESVIGSCPFITDFAPTCGNGLLEPNEECECAWGRTSCSFCQNCILDSGKECTPDAITDGDCCSSTGMFLTPDSTCTFMDCSTTGYCSLGSCISDVVCHTYDNLGDYDGVAPSNSCQYRCSDYDSDTIQSSNGIVMNAFPDGTVCGPTYSGTCTDGTCSESDSQAHVVGQENPTRDSKRGVSTSTSTSTSTLTTTTLTLSRLVEGCEGHPKARFHHFGDLALSKREQGYTLEECKNACQSDVHCQSFSHSETTKECQLWLPWRGPEELTYASSFDTYVCPGWAIAVDCERWDGMAPGAHPTSASKRLPCDRCQAGGLTAAECDAICKETPECHMFSYGINGTVTGFCSLWSSDATLRDLTTVQSLDTYVCRCRGEGKVCNCGGSRYISQPYECRCNRSSSTEDCGAGMYCWDDQSCRESPGATPSRRLSCADITTTGAPTTTGVLVTTTTVEVPTTTTEEAPTATTLALTTTEVEATTTTVALTTTVAEGVTMTGVASTTAELSGTTTSGMDTTPGHKGTTSLSGADSTTTTYVDQWSTTSHTAAMPTTTGGRTTFEGTSTSAEFSTSIDNVTVTDIVEDDDEDDDANGNGTDILDMTAGTANKALRAALGVQACSHLIVTSLQLAALSVLFVRPTGS